MSFQDDSKTIYSEMLRYRFRAISSVFKMNLKGWRKEDDVIIDVIARRRFGKEPVEEVAVPGVIKVYQDRFYMENQWNICVKATVIVE